MDNTLLSYIYYQTRVFQNESEDEIVYQMIKAFLVADGTYIVPIQLKEKQLSKEMERLPPGIYYRLLSLFTNVPSIDGRIDEYNMVKKILLSSGDHTFGDGRVSNDPYLRRAQAYPLIGFNNTGVSCYFNSLVQSILSLQTLRPYIEKYQLIQNYSKHYPAELLRQVQAHNRIAHSGQESASEYFLLLIEYWSKRANASGEGELDSIFQYTHTYDRKCTNCGLASSSIEQTTCMLIQENIIELFDYKETLDGYRCAQCFRPNTTVVTRYLSKAGDVIVVALNKYFGERLIEYPQNFTFENLMAGGRIDKYNLVATIEHNGSIDRGHYTARVKRDGKYYQTDDLEVSILPEQQFPALNTTYMLFYEIDHNIPQQREEIQAQEREQRSRLEEIERGQRLEEIEREFEQRFEDIERQRVENLERIEEEHRQRQENLDRRIREGRMEVERIERHMQEINSQIQENQQLLRNAPREEEGEVYSNTLERLRSISYNKPMVNWMNWDKVLALKTSIGIFSEEAGQLTNFAESEDQPNQEYLDADRDNMIFMYPYGNNKYKAFGYTLDQVLSTPNTNIIYECEKNEDGEYIRNKYNGVWGDGRIIPLEKKPNAYIKIPTESQVYVSAEELLGAIESGERVFLLYDPKNIELTVSHGVATGGYRVSDTHCQVGSDKTIYSLKVYTQQQELLDQQEKKERELQAKRDQKKREREQAKIEQAEREREQAKREREEQAKIEQKKREREQERQKRLAEIERERQERRAEIEQLAEQAKKADQAKKAKIEQDQAKKAKIEQEQAEIEQERYAKIEREMKERERQVKIVRERGKIEQEMGEQARHAKTKLEMKKQQEKKEQEKKAKVGGGREDAGSTVQGVMGLLKIFGM